VWKATIKGLMAHKLRLALTAVAVILGVAFMAGTFVLTDTINHTFDQLFVQVAKGKDTVVESRPSFSKAKPGSTDQILAPVPDRLVGLVKRVPGVALVDGVVMGYAQLVGKDGKAVSTGGAPSFGSNWVPDRQLSQFTVHSGRGPARPDEVAIDQATFSDKNFHLGDHVTVLTALAPRQVIIVGSLNFGSANNLAGARFVQFYGPTAQEVLGRPGYWSEIDVAAKPGVSSAQVTADIASALPPQYQAVTAASFFAQTAKSIEKFVGRLGTVLQVFALIALFVGSFIIYNTFSILITQRTRELALLRALGASRRQVNRSVLTESALVGLFASLLGLGAGVLLALGMQALFRAFGAGLPTTSLQMRPRTVIVSVIVGVVVTVLASLAPARRASRVPPVAAMGDTVIAEGASLRSRTLGAGLTTVAGLVLLVLGLVGPGGNRLLEVGVGAAIVFIGVAMLAPLVAGPLARILGAPLPALQGITGQLGRQNAVRNPRRTASTASALMIGVAMVTVVATLGATLGATFGRVIDQSIKSDYIVTTSGNNGGGFSPDLVRSLRAVPELATVAGGREARWHLGTTTERLTAIDAQGADQVLTFQMMSGSESALIKGEVLVDSAEAKSKHLSLGATLDMGFDTTGVQHLTVGGTYAPNQLLGKFVVSNAVYDQNYPPGGLLDFALVKDRAPAATALAAIKAVTKSYPTVSVQDQASFKAQQKKQVNQILTFVFVLLFLSILIAIIGIVNTLALSVIERTRELGLLRAVGMRRRQVRRMIRGEAVIVCLIGALLGIVVGLALGLALVAAIHFSTAKVISIPVATLVVVLIFAAVAGVLAAIFPARRAARLDVLEAIATA